MRPGEERDDLLNSLEESNRELAKVIENYRNFNKLLVTAWAALNNSSKNFPVDNCIEKFQLQYMERSEIMAKNEDSV